MFKRFNVLIVISIAIILLRAKCTNAEDQRPNFILYYPDTLRAESFNAYGNKVPDVSPNFDAFARSDGKFLINSTSGTSECFLLKSYL